MLRRWVRRDRSGLLGAALLGTAALVAAMFAVPITNSGLTGKITNSNDVATSNGYFTCLSAALSGSSTPYFTLRLNDAAGSQAVDSSGNFRNALYSTSGVTYGARGPCPRDGGQAVTLDGQSGMIANPYSMAAPTTFSEEIWFTTTTAGGRLIGYGNNYTGTSTSYDRHIFMTDAGKLIFGVYNSGVTYNEVTSPAGYADGQWHDVVATFGASGDANVGQRLYVDGALVAANASVTTAQAATGGYWRIGYDNLATWPNRPTNYYFAGSLAFASLYTYTLSAAQVAAHYRAGT